MAPELLSYFFQKTVGPKHFYGLLKKIKTLDSFTFKEKGHLGLHLEKYYKNRLVKSPYNVGRCGSFIEAHT